MSSKYTTPAPFPLHYFIQSIRSRILYITSTAVIVTLIQLKFTQKGIQYTSIAVMLLWAISVVFTLWRIKPFSRVLHRLRSMNIDLHHRQQIHLLYQKSEWEIVDKMLDFIEKEIIDQKKELKDQGRQEKSILASVPSAIVMTDKFQNIKTSNRKFRSLFGDHENEEKKLWKLIDHEILQEKFESAIESQNDQELFAFHKVDTNKYYDIKISPLKDTENEVIGVVGVFHDVTKNKLNEKMRVDFVANVSHEIRTPLTSIKGYAQLLEAQNSLPDEMKVLTEKINSNTEKLKDLFENLLNLSKIESQSSIKIKPTNIKALINKVRSDIEAKHGSKRVELEIISNIEEIFVDRKLFEQALANLLDNSFKYSSQPLKMKINVLNDPIEKDYINIEIQDNGPGIAGDQIKRIFERFYRVQGDLSSSVEGTGLGLSIVKHIINKHLGSIEVESEVGVGTKFIIHLPKEKAN